MHFRIRKLSMRVTTVSTVYFIIVEITAPKSTIVRWIEMQLKSLEIPELLSLFSVILMLLCFAFIYFLYRFILFTHWNFEKLWKRSSIGAKSVCKNSHPLYPSVGEILFPRGKKSPSGWMCWAKYLHFVACQVKHSGCIVLNSKSPGVKVFTNASSYLHAFFGCSVMLLYSTSSWKDIFSLDFFYDFAHSNKSVLLLP